MSSSFNLVTYKRWTGGRSERRSKGMHGTQEITESARGDKENNYTCLSESVQELTSAVQPLNMNECTPAKHGPVLREVSIGLPNSRLATTPLPIDPAVLLLLGSPGSSPALQLLPPAPTPEAERPVPHAAPSHSEAGQSWSSWGWPHGREAELMFISKPVVILDAFLKNMQVRWHDEGVTREGTEANLHQPCAESISWKPGVQSKQFPTPDWHGENSPSTLVFRRCSGSPEQLTDQPC